MGQYYKPICLDNELQEQWVYSHDYDNGLKLMEHSYIGNSFVGIVERLLSVGNLWYMKPLVWAEIIQILISFSYITCMSNVMSITNSKMKKD